VTQYPPPPEGQQPWQSNPGQPWNQQQPAGQPWRGSMPSQSSGEPWPSPGHASQAATGKPVRPWYRKKRFLIPAGVVALFIAIGATGGGDDVDKTRAAPSGSVTVEETAGAEQQAALDAEAEASASAEAQLQAEEEARRAEEEAQQKAEQEAAAAAAAAADAVRLDPASYVAISDRDWALIERDPDGHIGEKYVLYGYVTQFDSNTGLYTFRANTAGERKSSWYDYEINTMVTATDAAILSNVVKDDMVTMYVEVLKAYSYETTMGGSMTVPAVTVNMIEVTGHA